jgi:hypothetical protein
MLSLVSLQPMVQHHLQQGFLIGIVIPFGAIAGCGAEGYVEVGGFVRENATALARLVTPQISKGYLRKRRAAPRGGYSFRYYVLDSAVRSPSATLLVAIKRR